MELTEPYYAVIFTSERTLNDKGYLEMAKAMEHLAQKQAGFIAMETARSGLGITVSYWKTLQAIADWKTNVDHQLAQQMGKTDWYSWYKVRICKVEREYGFVNRNAP